VKGEVVIEQEVPVVIGEADDSPDEDDEGPVFIERQILSAARPQLRYRLAPRQYLKIFRTYGDAEQFFRDQLAQDEKSGNPRQVQNGLLGLATILNAVGKPKEAVPLFERALALAAENRNTEREVRLCRRLGATYRDGLKDFAKATAMYQRALAIQQRRTPSGASVGLAQAYTALGRTAGYAGDTSAWVASMEKAVAIHRRLDPGERRMTTAKGYKNLADAYGAAGRRDDALRVYRQTLALKQKLRPGGRDPSLARSLGDLGQSYVQMGKPAAGLPYLRQALQMRVELFDGSHPSIANSHDDLGRAYARAGDAARALASFRQALDLRLKLYPDGAHPSLLRSYRNLGKAAREAGNTKAAEEYEARAKEMKEELED
ncbi:MAG: tetratricopeptide repeat protein, partial [Rhodocyclaceae bacterium]